MAAHAPCKSALQLPYLLEWITYYQIQGAHRVAICDLMSTDKCGLKTNRPLICVTQSVPVAGWSRRHCRAN
jgi:hypothetical protein